MTPDSTLSGRALQVGTGVTLSFLGFSRAAGRVVCDGAHARTK